MYILLFSVRLSAWALRMAEVLTRLFTISPMSEPPPPIRRELFKPITALADIVNAIEFQTRSAIS